MVIVDSRARKMKGQPLEMKEKERVGEIKEEMEEFYRNRTERL